MKERQLSLQNARGHEFDLVVVGGGIAGAGVAQNAAARGLSVLLLEKDDFASAASGKSKQLISPLIPHADQRSAAHSRQYAEERERLRRLAPHLIKDISIALPFTRKVSFDNLKALFGQSFSDILHKRAQLDASTILNKKTLAKLVPALSIEQVSGGIRFPEYITDDARFVLAVLEAAQFNGAELLNYVQATELLSEEGMLKGVKCRDRNSGDEFLIRCRICVNATGAWSAGTGELWPAAPPEASFVKRTQIVVPRSAFETNSAVLLPAKAGKFVTVLPWKHALLIGSAESPFSGEAGKTACSEPEINYLLDAVNNFTESHRLSVADISGVITTVSSDCASDKVSSKNSSCDSFKLNGSPEGVYVVRSSLSDYRIVSDNLLAQISADLHWLCKRPAGTGEQMLGGWTGKDDFLSGSSAIEIKGKRLKIDQSSITHLIENYGKRAEHLIDLLEKEPSFNRRIVADFPPLMVEIPYAIVNEMALCLQDFFFRRTRLALLNQRNSLKAAPQVAELMGKFLRWDSRRISAELSALEAEIFESRPGADKLSV